MSKQPNQNSKAIAKPLTEGELNAQIALTGNLAGLTPEQQMLYYERYCRHLGLDPITRPFDLLTTYDDNGVPKTVLYANASCSAQLADKREVSYGKPEKEYDPLLGVLTIRVEAFVKIADGRFRGTHRSGVAHIDGLKGKRLENAIKKAETQAHRRATLALCGVAMPDESEIEDIPGAQVSPLPQITDGTPTAEELFDAPRQSPDTPLPSAWTDDSAARQLADQEIANKLNAELQTISEEIAAEAPERQPVLTEKGLEQKERQMKADLKAAREKHISTPAPKTDPVPLTVTLTSAQQKASNAVMIAIWEHKKDKATILHLIGQYLGREVKRSADLTDVEAEKVSTYLQTLCSQWSAADPQPELIEYGQNRRAHAPDRAEAMDAEIKKLAVLGVSAANISAMISDVVEKEISGRKIENRYALNDSEAAAVIQFLADRVAEKECEEAVARDEV